MISYLRGTILAVKEKYIILCVDERVGYRIFVPGQILEQIHFNQEVALYIYTYVREDALDLYGFPTLDELDFFEKLLGVAGVGPKSALGVLSVAPLADIKKAVIHGDASLLQKVSNIGKKTAERIIIDLKEKISVTESEDAAGISITDNVKLIEALQSLGYKDGEIRRVMQELPRDKKELSEKIKEALQLLSTNSRP